MGATIPVPRQRLEGHGVSGCTREGLQAADMPRLEAFDQGDGLRRSGSDDAAMGLTASCSGTSRR